MRSLAIKKFWNKLIYSKIVFIIIIIISIYILYRSAFIIIKYYDFKKQVNILEEKKTVLEKEIQNKNEEYNYLNTDRGVEELLKIKYGLAPAEEKEIILHISDKKMFQEINAGIEKYPRIENIKEKVEYFFKNYTNIDY